MVKFSLSIKHSFVALCVVLSGIALTAVPASASGLSATTNEVTNVTANGATLNGHVTYSGNSYNTVFAIGTKSDLSDPVFTYSEQSWTNRTLFIRTSTHDMRPTGSASTSFDFNWWTPTGSGSELQPSTTYYVRVGVQTGPDTLDCIWTFNCYVWGGTTSFTTRAAILPESVTGSATSIGATTANIDGSVIANDAGVSVFVEYGKTADLSGNTLSEFGKASDMMGYCYGTDCERVQAGTTSRTITRSLADLEPETTYFYRVVARNPYGTTYGEIKSFMTTPPVGLTINDGATYTTSKNVKLSISWPVGATAMTLSNDGGFRAGTTVSSSLRSTFDWTLDDSVQGMYPKIVYVRFSGPGIDVSRSYTDDIIFDSIAPVISNSSAKVDGGLVAVSLAARDDESGLSTVEINNGDRSVISAYSTRVLVKTSDLGLGVVTSSVRKASITDLKIRISDRAGNTSPWTSLGKSSGVVVPVAEPANGTIAGSPTGGASQNLVTGVAPEKGLSYKSLAKIARVKVPKGARISARVASSSAKKCKASGAVLVTLKTGTCVVTITVKPKKGKAVKKTVTLTLVK